MHFLPRAAAIAALLATSSLSAQTLTIGLGAPATSVDPHFYQASTNLNLAMHVFDRLVDHDGSVMPVPGLAESWKPISDTEWEFRLREGVTWHDGQPFTGDDVVFSYNRARNVPGSPAGFGPLLRAVTEVTVVDARTLRIRTSAPRPLLPIELSSVAIVSRHAGEGATTEDYNSGRAAIGTGPYRLESFRSGEGTQLIRNETWWGPRQHWARVHMRYIPAAGARTAAMLSGDVDLIDQVPATDLPRFRSEQRVSMVESPSFRYLYLQADRSRTGSVPFVTDNDGKPLEANPFLDLRVRQAMNIAINRTALAERVMDGAARPTMQFIPDGLPSNAPDVRPPAVDVERAKQLLREAGFPNGFRLTLFSPNDRYPNDSKIAQAIAQMWGRIGIQTQVEPVPFASFATRLAKQEFGVWLIGGASSTGESSFALNSTVGTNTPEIGHGATNRGYYSNALIDALGDRASTIMDDEQRNTLLREGVKMAMDDVAIFPLMHLNNLWAVRRGLSYEASMEERTTAMATRPSN